ncbi:PKD domain-containing protein [uncultured Zobellia sp.]|uniref:PKD domain-containing protein n=1 Tax=uncultured Zobellia sp. TaxID=255433 RepID=UPI002593C054|nr:PKD domain-containing protein [uncultured Zobellia sp.]
MNTRHNLVYFYFLGFILLSFLVNLSCAKDIDELRDAVLKDGNPIINETSDQLTENQNEVVPKKIDEENLEEHVLESRTTVFPPVHDAHLQSGKGFNQDIVRLEENRRISYLMFDLSPIDSIGGLITQVNLRLTINSDDGSGKISVFKGTSSNWSENELSEDTAPEEGIELGTIIKKYEIDKTEFIQLTSNQLTAEVSTLILVHKDGNDLAFASKEHPNNIGPALVVTYKVPEGTEKIVVTSEITAEEDNDEFESEEVKTDNDEGIASESEEETSELEKEETTQGETTQEETSEEETPQEETTEVEVEEEVEEEVEVEEEATPEEETPQEETTEEDQEETPNEETPDEEVDQGGSGHTNEEPMAVADATPTSGEGPLKVNFTGSNSSDDAGIVSYFWDFRDGTTATEANPLHTFTAVGSYEVELTVYDGEGLTSTDMVTITVREEENNAPTAKISATPISGDAPLEVSFKGDNSTDDNAITSYLWSFEDGASATNANPSYTFTTAGSYPVELTVSDENGLTDKETVVITVEETQNEPPVAKLSANPTSGTIPLQIQFIGNKSTDDIGITTFSWDFKDGGTATDADPSHTFTEPGTYTVNLTVTDGKNLSNTESVTITASAPQNQNPIASASANRTSGDAPLEVQFIGDNSIDDEGVVSYVWNFQDGSSATDINPIHTFSDSGTYPVELTVTDAAGLTNTAIVNITVNQTSTGTAPEGSYYVTTNGSSSNNGLSESSAWSIEYAFQNAKAGDYVYIKAGNYGNITLRPGHSGTAGNPVRFIGYRNTPGDIQTNNGSSFEYGDQLDANKMPLLQGNRINKIGQGSGIFNFHKYIEISNIQITHYAEGAFSSGEYTKFDNIIATEIGDFNPAHTYPNNTSNPSLNYAGVGIKVTGDNSIIKNCFVLNAGAEGFRFSDCQNQTQSYNKVYSDSQVNPCDYYYLLSIDARNNDVSNIYVERVGDLEHLGHGLVLKFNARNNTIRNSTVKNTWLELSYSGVANNQFTNCTITGGPNNQGALLIANGAHDNTFTQCRVTKCDGVAFADWDEDFSRGDVRDAGHHNTFKQCTFDNNLAGIFFFWYSQDNTENLAHDNTFDECTFRDMENLFLVDRENSNTLLKNCTIRNINTLRDSFLPTLHSGISLDATYQNNTLQNCGFTLN